MNDHELERRMRGWYRREIEAGGPAPVRLRIAIDAIPAKTSRSWQARRGPALLLAAALTTAIGGAFAVGSGLFHMPNEVPIRPPNLAATTPTPSLSPEATPAASPDRLPTEPTSRPVFEPGFQSIGEMSTARFQHTATLLEDGRVLIAGGSSLKAHVLGTTEIWDPATETFTMGPRLMVARFGHKATRLADGRVVIVGGFVAGDRGTRAIELWDPATGAFRAAGLTTLPRDGSLTTVLLADGRVLILGGVDCGFRPSAPNPDSKARELCLRQQLMTEIWDPATESVTVSGSLEEEHDWAAATLLDDGHVFVLGGGGLPTIGSEVWDPATGTWSHGGAPADARQGGQSLTLLPDGRVLVIGGQTGKLNVDAFLPPLRSAVLWDPATSSFSDSGSMSFGRERHTATLLVDGRILVVGGVGGRARDFSDTAIPDTEVWDPATASFTSGGRAAVGRALHTATLLQDGRVLITGGFERAEKAEVVSDLPSAEIWAP